MARETFRTLLDHLLVPYPGALITEAALSTVLSMATELAPVFCGGLECRLSARNDQVDLHQCIQIDSNHPALLAAHIRRHPDLERHAIWAALATLCDRWQEANSPLAQCMDELWLEWDADSSNQCPPIPAVFASLARQQATTAGTVFHAIDCISRLLNIPLPDTAVSLARDLPTGHRITHVGLMASRPGHPIRINMAGMRPDALSTTLRTIGWPGNPDSVQALTDAIAPHGDGVILCLDAGKTLCPTLGLECPSSTLAGYTSILTELTARGLCAPDKAAALLEWPLEHVPEANSEWPATLIRQSLLLPVTSFTRLTRSINHIKLTVSPDSDWSAKAYLWFGHRPFSQPKPVSGERHRP